MAKPIEETPILSGKDAETFLDTMRRNEFKTISIEELNKMKENFEKIKSVTFPDSKNK